jgi:hypothetical protein
MRGDERRHIALTKLWKAHAKLRLLSEKETVHLGFCDRCLAALVVCRISETLEEADRRLQDYLQPDKPQ